MMKKSEKLLVSVVAGFAVACLSWTFASQLAQAALGIPQDFDQKGEKIYKRYDSTPLSAMTGTDGTRSLNTYYQRRQYPGSPPTIPHEVPRAFSGDTSKCLSCHERGGYVAALNAYAPVTPHPENVLCFQCHVPIRTEKLFVETEWESIDPPLLGRSMLGGSPPPIPHSLQLREDCIACHTGNGAVAELRVEHGSRGNCRQCHVPQKTTTVFQRNN
jgi:cytochrome c-type protein NapB